MSYHDILYGIAKYFFIDNDEVRSAHYIDEALNRKSLLSTDSLMATKVKALYNRLVEAFEKDGIDGVTSFCQPYLEPEKIEEFRFKLTNELDS